MNKLNLEKIEDYLRLYRTVEVVIDSNCKWEHKRMAVFNKSVFDAMQEIYPVDLGDRTSMSHEDEIMAFYDAATSVALAFQTLVDKVNKFHKPSKSSVSYKNYDHSGD